MENGKQNRTVRKNKTRMLCECAVMLALSTVLSFVKIWTMPWGGSITLVSMLPIMLISIKYGMITGVCTSVAYALIQAGLDLGLLMGWGMTPAIWAGTLVFDYFIAFTVLGIAGIWRKHGVIGNVAGIVLAIILRFSSHVFSGCVFFSEMRVDAWFTDFPLVFYSSIYNGCFMLPEMLLTVIVAVIILKLPVTKRLLALDK